SALSAAWPTETAWSAALDLCQLGDGHPVAAMGSANLSSPLRHRDQLPTVEPGTHTHEHPQSSGAVVLCRPGAAASQRLGVVARPGPGNAAAGPAPPQPAPASLPHHAALAAPCDRTCPRMEGLCIRRTTCTNH